MTIEQKVARIFQLNDENWMRHANPKSVWSRFSVLPLLIVAFWSRAWIGWWALIPVALAMAWMFLNPVAFKPPKSTRNWASKAVLGERVWSNRRDIPVPEQHRLLPSVLNGFSAAGMLLVIWGVVNLSVWPTITGAAVGVAFKLWYVDRMVWRYEDMKHVPEYGTWLY